jgi:hypothetical protein
MANEMIPVIDLGPYLAGIPGAIDRFSPAILLVQGVDRICQPQMDEM